VVTSDANLLFFVLRKIEELQKEKTTNVRYEPMSIIRDKTHNHQQMQEE
jgi:hypothetical protein